MNILVPHNWLCDYIETDASPQEIARALSLHAFSVETLRQVSTPSSTRGAQGKKDDWVYEIEITTNRGDALSVLGIARELGAILPKQGFGVKWQQKKVAPGAENNKLQLEVEIKDKMLVPRFSAIVLDGVKISESPDFIKQRLEQVGMRPLNSVVDITNYLMFDKGQPMHAFDYDKILGGKMVVRESKKGEKLTTLDDIERELPAGVIVIEDGNGCLIDLCGIMGAKNSEVDEETKRVLLFVQVYDPARIRQASMALGHRTEAALRFEKGIDFEGVVPALWEAVDFLKKYANAQEASKLIDILNIEYQPKSAPIDYEKINLVAGVEITKDVVDKTLTDLGFEVKNGQALVPSWRYGDVAIAEDLAEEVVRLYGYANLPNKLLNGDIPTQIVDPIFYLEELARNFLKHQGFFECYTNSATNEKMAGKGALKLANPLTEEFHYLKTSLLPQLLAVIEKNQGFNETIKIFELASVYLADRQISLRSIFGGQAKQGLPSQPLRLGITTKGIEYLEIKGMVEGLLKELGVKERVDFTVQEFGDEIFGVELDFENLAKKASQVNTYTPLTSFNSIKEDLTLVISENITYQQIEKLILGIDPRIIKLEFKDIYKNFLTLAIEYLDKEKQISSVETQEIRKEIFEKLEKKLNVKLKM
jgi:phenylalanyl-tRNA synthetase beta chain